MFTHEDHKDDVGASHAPCARAALLRDRAHSATLWLLTGPLGHHALVKLMSIRTGVQRALHAVAVERILC